MNNKSTPPESFFPLDLQHITLFSGQTMQKKNNVETTLTSVSAQLTYIHTNCGLGRLVVIATRYCWRVRGSNPGGGEIFRTCPDRPWGPPSLLCNGYWVFPGGKEQPGRDADPSPPSSAVGHKRVELYLYSPYGPYGLYRASVPYKGCTLTLH